MALHRPVADPALHRHGLVRLGLPPSSRRTRPHCLAVALTASGLRARCDQDALPHPPSAPAHPRRLPLLRPAASPWPRAPALRVPAPRRAAPTSPTVATVPSRVLAGSAPPAPVGFVRPHLSVCPLGPRPSPASARSTRPPGVNDRRAPPPERFNKKKENKIKINY